MAPRLVHILPEHVASQIAAGEVVERPASAVKELAENSLDAGARSITAEIARGGVDLIAISDDGAGMSREDAILSIRRHATSKIRDAADLAAVRTLGFRGEALASIASVSRLVLRTRAASASSGTELATAGSETPEVRECAAAPGTQIEVRELFFNTPARLKFMKTIATEQGAVAEVIQRLALANPAVAFRLIVDGRELIDAPRASSLRERFRQLFGERLASSMMRFELNRERMRAGGLLSMSQESFPTARMVFTFANRRAVRDRMLSRALANAYQALIPRGRHPAAVLFIEVPPDEVDVNVHPMKTEVRFRKSGAVFELAYRAIRDRLANQTEGALGAEPAAATIAPIPGGEDRVGVAPAGAGSDLRPLRLVADSAPAARSEQSALGLGFASGAGDSAAIAREESRAAPMYSRLRILGQLFAGYIGLDDADGLILVDQHAAHERITFEKLRAELRNGGIRVQAMLVPQPLELNPARAAAIQSSLGEIRALGFDLEPFGPATFVLKGAPAVFGAAGGVKLLSDMLESVGEGGLTIHTEPAFEDRLKLLACHGSIRVGRMLDGREIHELLAELDRTEFKTTCPHGRPVHIRFARGQIERMFRR